MELHDSYDEAQIERSGPGVGSRAYFVGPVQIARYSVKANRVPLRPRTPRVGGPAVLPVTGGPARQLICV